jgi:hypothetical protein
MNFETAVDLQTGRMYLCVRKDRIVESVEVVRIKIQCKPTITVIA